MLMASAGIASAQCNSVINGNFSGGATGFTTGLTQSCSTSASTGPNGGLDMTGAYCISTNTNTNHMLFNNCTYQGNMMVVNASTTANTAVWAQTVSVMPNTTYRFTVQAVSAYPQSPAQLVLSVNGMSSAATTLSTTMCSWQTITYVWNSGSATSANLLITNANLDPSGNDFAIDNISFSAVPTVTTTVMNSGSGCNTSTGSITVTQGNAGPYMYSLNGGSYQTSNMFSNLGAGTYTVRVANACGDTSMATATVTGGGAPTVTVSSSTDASSCVCPIIPTGSITVTTTGTGPFTYSLNNGPWMALPANKTITGLTAMNSYTIRVKDSCGNISMPTASVTISKKVKIRHYTGSKKNPYQDICIDSLSVASHIANHTMWGDTSKHDYVLDPCASNNTTPKGKGPGKNNNKLLGGGAQDDIIIAPNPNKGMFKVQLPQLEGDANLIITDVQGRVMRKAVISQDRRSVDVQMTELGKGVYFINVSDGHHTYTARFIAE